MSRAALFVLALACACASRRKPDEQPAPPPAKEPAVQEAAIEGNDNVSARDLRAAARREIRAYFREGHRASNADDAAYAMELLLREKGFPRGRVSFTAEGERLVFKILEGPRAFLGGIEFEGIDPLERPDLMRFFVFDGSGPLGTGDPFFQLALIESAAKDVERYYLLHGYLKVRIGAPRVTWNPENTRADITIPIEKGPTYVVTRVDVKGATDLPDLGLAEAPYHVRLPAEAAAKVRRIYLDRGHQRVSVDADATVDDDRAAVTVTLVIDPGPQVTLREVRFEGQRRTRPFFLRRRLPIEETEVVLQALLDRGIDNLWRTGLFSTVQARTKQVGADQLDLEIKLEEIQARSVDFELGYGSYELARGAVRYRNRNLFGTGRRFTAELRGSVRSQGVDLRIADPYLLGDRTLLEVGAAYLLREEPSFDREAIGFDVTLTRRLREKYRLRAGYQIRSQEADDIQQPLTPDQEDEFLRTAGLFAALRRDTRDSILLPTRGNFAEVAVLWSSPAFGADNDFLELDVWTSQLIPVGRGVVVFGARFITRELLDSSATLPIQERLFLGGATTVRSFFESELGPSVMGEPQGGLTSILGSVEFRHPIWRQLYGAVFYDIGNVSPSALSWTGAAGHAIGVGLRYYFPVGPLRVDFGWNPGRQFAADEPWALHLAFGFSF